MSNARITKELNSSSSKTNSQPGFNLQLYAKIAWIFIFMQIQRINAMTQGMNSREFEAFHAASDTWYQFSYTDETPFPLPYALERTCNMEVGTPPPNSVEYEPAVDVTCNWQGQPGPVTQINNEVNKTLSAEFINCLNGVLRDLCNMYNDWHHRPIPNPPSPDNSTDIWPIVLGVGCVLFLVAGCVCIASCLCGNGNTRRNSSSASSESTPVYVSSSYSPPTPTYYGSSGGSSALSFLNLLPSPTSSSTSATGGYQGVSGSTNSTAESSTLTWNFHKR
jgi:hypothetical protein